MLLFLFCAQFVLLDPALRRGRALEGFASAGAAVATFQSVCLWFALGLLSRRGRGARAVVALAAGSVLALQVLFFRRFGQWIDAQVIRSALADFRDIAPGLKAELPGLALAALGCAVVEYLWLVAAQKRLPGKVRLRVAAVPALLFAALVPLASPAKGPPDMRLAAGALPSRSRPAAAGAARLPQIPTRTAALPNVVLIITESVRADDYCSAPASACPTAPEVNALLKDRVGLPQMRSVASYTRVSMAALVTGRSQDISKQELFSSPTVFDAVKAIDPGLAAVYTAYWSSHYFPIFHWEDPRRAIDSYVTREDLYGAEGDGDDGDARLAAYAARRLAELPSPYFVVLHFHDTHILYTFDEASAPFTPWTRKVTWETMPGLRNAYRNSIHFQDRWVAQVIAALRRDERWSRTAVLFTSDHGEEFGEHGQIHHGQDLLDEQVHVPGWVAFGPAALSAEQVSALRGNAGAFLTHLDVAPTILDLFGVLDAYGLGAHVRRMDGRSLLRPFSGPPPAVALTNCSEAFPCPWSTWGVARGDRKLEAQAWDAGWNCRGLGGGRESSLPLDEPGCAALVAEARRRFDTMPNGAPNRAAP